MQIGKIQPLRDVIVELGKLVEPDGRRLKEEVRSYLFIPRQRPWTLQSPAVLLELNEVPAGTKDEDMEEVETPELAKREKLQCVLFGAEVQDIIANARWQKPDVGLDEIFDAFLYYYKFEAFKDMS